MRAKDEHAIEVIIRLIKFLTVRRQEMGITQTELAKRIQTSQSAISDWEASRAEPSLSSLM